MQKHSSSILLVSVGLLGAAYALTIFDLSFVLARSPYWTQPYGDHITNQIGALYFARDEWRFPLFFVPKLGFPEGTNVIFTDSIPLLAFFGKIIFQLTGHWFNYLGIWLFVSFPLLAFFTALAVKEAGVKDPIAIVGAAVLAMASPALLIRFGHAALMAHFLIPWSIFLYFRLLNAPNERGAIVQFCLAAMVAILLQAYFLAMVLPFLLAALAQTAFERRQSFASAAMNFAIVLAVTFATAWLAGTIGADKAVPHMWGYGFYSMNAISPFLPPRDHLPAALAKLVTWDGAGRTWDATGGQYEGYNYLGAGILLLAVVHRSLRRHFDSFRHHAFLIIILLGYFCYALSNRVFLGDWLALDIPLPGIVQKFTGYFRTGGRYFWPIYYVLAIALVFATYRRFGQRSARILIVIAVLIQLADTQTLRRNLAVAASHGFPQALNHADWRALLASHKFLEQYPSFQCGGWAGKWPDNNSNLELLLIAAELDMPTNSVYVGRIVRDCSKETTDGVKFDIRPDGLYVFSQRFPIRQIEGLPHFREWCRQFQFGIACSRTWTAAHLAALSSFQPISQSWALPEYRIGETLRFSAGGNGLQYLAAGWSVPESWGLWSLGNESEIALRLTGDQVQDLRLTSNGVAFTHALHPTTEILVFANKQQIATWKYAGGEGTKKFEADIPKTLREGGILRITFKYENVKSPKQAGVSEDPRLLSFGLVDLTLSPR